MRLYFLISVLWFCVACGSGDEPVPLDMRPAQAQIENEAVAASLTFDPTKDFAVEVVEASARIDASTPKEPEVVIEYEHRDYLVSVHFPDDATLDDVLEFEYGIGDYEERDDGGTRMVPSEVLGTFVVSRESRQSNLGFLKLTVPFLQVEGERENPARAWVRPTTIGWQQRRYWSPSSYDKELSDELYRDLGRHGVEEDGMNLIQVHARRGITVAGVVLSPEGEPVDQGRVYLKRHTSKKRTRTDRRVNIGFDGRFEFHISREATYTLRASVDEVGLGEIKELEIDPASEPLELVIQLVGPGTIEGLVRDQHGLPVPGFPVFMKRSGDLLEVPVVASEDDAVADADSVEGETPVEEVPVIDQTVGLTSMTATTDANGHFIAKGLRPGTYAMYERTIRNNNTKLIQDGVQTTWEEPVELVVKATRFLVSAYEPGSGDPVPWSPKGHEVEGREALLSMVHAPSGQRRGHSSWRKTDQDHTWALWVETNHEYRILLGSSERKFVERTVLVNPGQDRIEVAITLSPKIEAAIVRVFATDPPDTRDVSGHYAYLHSLEANTNVSSASTNELGGVMEMTVPPGTYRMTVSPQSNHWGWSGRHGNGMSAMPKPHTEVIDLAPGSTTSLHVETSPSGGIQLRLSMPPIPDLDLGPNRSTDEPVIRVRGTGPDGETTHQDIQTYAVWYYRDRGKPYALRPAGTLANLTPGTWHLEIEAPGFEPLETWVDVEHAEYTAASATLVLKGEDPTEPEAR